MPHRPPNTLWETALGQLELQVTRPNYETWLRDSVGLRFEENVLTVGVPTDFVMEWLRSRLSPLINRTISRIANQEISVSFEVLGVRAPAASAPAADHGAMVPAPDLHADLTFESFTVVPSYRLAYRAAQSVAKGNSRYNPLILCGPPGLGKTHLLHAIGHAAHQDGRSIALLTAERFVDRYTSAVRDGHPHTFREAFRDIDQLLLDDLHFLAPRQGSQQQFFHILDSLILSGRQIILTSNTPPESLTGLSPQLLSRLRAGLTIELRLPPKAERLTILHGLSSRLPTALPNDVLQLIHREPCSHIRDLVGSLNRVSAYAELSDDPVSIQAATSALRPPGQSSRPPAPATVLELVASHFSLTVHDLTGPSRARDIAYARHIAMYLLKQHAQRGSTAIGHLLGNRDHSTVLNGCRRIASELKSLEQTQADINALESFLSEAS